MRRAAFIVLSAAAWACSSPDGDDLFRPGSGGSSTGEGGRAGSAGSSHSESGHGGTGLSGTGGTAGAGSPGVATGGTGNVGGANGTGGTTAAGSSGTAGASGCTQSNSGVEVCDGLDNDCNGSSDEGNVCLQGCVGVQRAGHGYMFCEGPEQKHFIAAENQCAALGMHLVALETKDENDWLEATATEFGIEEPLWIGASDRAEEGHWKWPDGTEFWIGAANGAVIPGMYENWQTGKPNNQTSAGREEDCAFFDFGNGWNDLECEDDDSHFSFVCERD